MVLSVSQYAMLHGERVLEGKIAELRMALSEQNLELLPDYEQRIAVLKELQFIDDNSTVLLKGRVACEVSFFVPRGRASPPPAHLLLTLTPNR